MAIAIPILIKSETVAAPTNDRIITYTNRHTIAVLGCSEGIIRTVRIHETHPTENTWKAVVTFTIGETQAYFPVYVSIEQRAHECVNVIATKAITTLSGEITHDPYCPLFSNNFPNTLAESATARDGIYQNISQDFIFGTDPRDSLFLQTLSNN